MWWEMCFGGWFVLPSNLPSKVKRQRILCAFLAVQARNVLHMLCRRWCWGLRFNFKKGDFSWPHGHGGRKKVGALRETLLRPTYIWEDRGCSTRVARRKWRTTRRLDALAGQSGAASGDGGNASFTP